MTSAQTIASAPARKGVLFDPTITLGHVLTTVAMVVAGLTWGMRLESRVDRTEERALGIERRIDRDDAQQRETTSEIKAALRRIEDKIDQKADRAK